MTDAKNTVESKSRDMPSIAFAGTLVLLFVSIAVAVLFVREQFLYLSLAPAVFGFLTLGAAFSKRTLVGVLPWLVLMLGSTAVILLFFSRF